MLILYLSPYLMFDGARSIMHVVPAHQQVQHWAIPLKSDVMALLSLTTGSKRERRKKDFTSSNKPERETEVQQQKDDNVRQHVCQR